MTIAEEIAKITKANGGSTKNSTTILGAVQDLVKSKGGSNADTGNIADAVKQYSKVEGGGGSSNPRLNVHAISYQDYVPIGAVMPDADYDCTVKDVCTIYQEESTDPNYDEFWAVELTQFGWMIVPYEDDNYYFLFSVSSTVDASDSYDEEGMPYNVYWFDDDYANRNGLVVYEGGMEWPQYLGIRSSSSDYKVLHVRYKGIDGSVIQKNISLNVTFYSSGE